MILTLALSLAALVPATAPAEPTPLRDDTAWLQASLDRGGTTFLPRLPNGECYRTLGLWISHDDTSLVSDGACVVGIGAGASRLRAGDDEIVADAVVYVNRTTAQARAPAHVRIEGVRLVVPQGLPMYGIEIQGSEVDVGNVEVDGFPKDALLVGGRASGDAYSSDVRVHDSRLLAGGRNVVSVTGVRGLAIERCVIAGATDTWRLPGTRRRHGNPAAGIDVEPDSPVNPTVDVTIADDTIAANAGPGIILSLNPSNRPALAADGIRIVGNRIIGNGTKRTPPARGGIAIGGGQRGTAGHVEISRNVIARNRGFGLFGGTTMVVDAHANVFSGNGGRWRFTRLGRGSRLG